MHRCWTTTEALAEDRVQLDEQESKHLLKVVRARPGETVKLLDGAGGTAEGLLEETVGRSARVRVTFRCQHPPPRVRLTLFQALPKPGRLEWVVQKAAELGAAEVVLVQARHCVTRWPEEGVQRRVDRFQRVAREAAKQSGSVWLTRVRGPVSFKAMLDETTSFDAFLWGALGGEVDPLFKRVCDLAKPDCKVRSVAALVGPEGDFSTEEREALEALPLFPVSLGPRVLRTETAAVVFLSLLSCALEDQE